MTIMNECGEFVDEFDPNADEMREANNRRNAANANPASRVGRAHEANSAVGAQEVRSQGVFDKITDVSLAQIDALMNADKDDLPLVIEQSKAVSQLLTNLNNNMGNAVKVAHIMAMDGMDVGGLKATMPRMLGGK